ncbi:MAG: hypothetical protein WC002_01280 [Candidatus Muiribacteriota bacterium]
MSKYKNNVIKILVFIFILTFTMFLTACKNDTQLSERINSANVGFDGTVYFRNQDFFGNIIEVPIKGAEISLSTNTYTTKIYTDKNGYFYFDKNSLNNREYILKIASDYFPEYREEVDLRNINNVSYNKKYYIDGNDFAFDNSAIIGKVLINGKPASNIKVRLGLIEYITDGQGFFVFKNLNQGEYFLKTLHDEFVNVAKKVEIEHQSIIVNNIIELSKHEVNVAGKIIDKSTREPIENVRVEASYNSQHYYYASTAHTGNNGEFYFDNLIEGEYIFTFIKENYYINSLKINIGNSNEISKLQGVELNRGDSNLIVRLIDSSSKKPVSNVVMKINNGQEEYISDNSGRITVYGLTKTSHKLTFTSDFYNSMEKSIFIEDDVMMEEYEIVSKFDAAKIRGYIYTEDNSEVLEVDIGNDNFELANFSLFSISDGVWRITPYKAARGQKSNEYVFENIPSGRYLFDPILIIDDTRVIPDFRSGGIYGLANPIMITINTGEEMKFDLYLKKE